MITSIDQIKCTGCGTCVKSCTLDVFSLATAQSSLAPCMLGCPCEVDIRGIIYLMQQDRLEEALSLLKQSVPFPALTSRLCTHPCENDCIRQPLEESVNILGLERFLGELDLGLPETEAPVRHLAPVAVVGSGPAGLACAWFLRTFGYHVTLFEQSGVFGGSLRHLSDNGITEQILSLQLNKVRGLGVEFRCNTGVGPGYDVGWAELLEHGFKAFCLAGGSQMLDGIPFAGAEINSQGFLEVDPLTRQSGNSRFFAAGGVCGAENMETALAQARFAAMSIDRYLRGTDLLSGRLPAPGLAEHLPPLMPAKPRTAGGRTATAEGMSLEEVQQESLRCMTCGSKAFLAHTDDCMTCFTCEMKCPAQAIRVHPFKEILPRSLEKLGERC